MSTSGTQLTPTQQRQVNVQQFFTSDKVKAALQMALPRHMTPTRQIRVLLSAIMRTPLLLECSNVSLVSALVKCSELGLEPNNYECHLVPFRNNTTKPPTTEVTVIPDYKGLVKLAYRSDMVASCMGRAVRANDKFAYKYGTGAFLDFEPADSDDRGELTFAWAMAKLTTGGEVFVVLNKSEVMKRKAASASARRGSGPWKTYPDAMWAKSAFRELSKWIPQSPELQQALQHEDSMDLGDSPVVLDISSVPTQTKSERLAEELTGQTETPAPEAPASEPEPEPKTDGPPDEPTSAARMDVYGSAQRRCKATSGLKNIWEKIETDPHLDQADKEILAAQHDRLWKKLDGKLPQET